MGILNGCLAHFSHIFPLLLDAHHLFKQCLFSKLSCTPFLPIFDLRISFTCNISLWTYAFVTYFHPMHWHTRKPASSLGWVLEQNFAFQKESWRILIRRLLGFSIFLMKSANIFFIYICYLAPINTNNLFLSFANKSDIKCWTLSMLMYLFVFIASNLILSDTIPSHDLPWEPIPSKVTFCLLFP